MTYSNYWNELAINYPILYEILADKMDFCQEYMSDYFFTVNMFLRLSLLIILVQFLIVFLCYQGKNPRKFIKGLMSKIMKEDGEMPPP